MDIAMIGLGKKGGNMVRRLMRTGRSGKRLPQRLTEVAIQFKQIPLSLFGWRNLAGDDSNVLVLNIQPNEGITLRYGTKVPGPVNEIQPVRMNFEYHKTFGGEPPEAYERLLMDALMGDATLFTRSDERMQPGSSQPISCRVGLISP